MTTLERVPRSAAAAIAASITRRWPRWTPSKLPSATVRAAGSARSRLVSITRPAPRPVAVPARPAGRSRPAAGRAPAARAPSHPPPAASARAARPPARGRPAPAPAGAAAPRAAAIIHGPSPVLQDPLRRGGPIHRELPHLRAPQLAAVAAGRRRGTQVGRDLADVRALRAAHVDHRPLRLLVERDQLQPLDRHHPRRRRLGLAPPHARVGALSGDPHGRGQRHLLQHLAGERGRRLPHGGSVRPPAGLRDLSLRVERRGDRAELHDRAVALVQAGQERRQPRRPSRQHQQQAGRERVERAGVPHLRAGQRPQPADHRERRRSRGLVDEQQSCHAPQSTRRIRPAGLRPHPR